MTPDQVATCRTFGAQAFVGRRLRNAAMDQRLNDWLRDQGMIGVLQRNAAYKEFRAGWLTAQRVAQSVTGWGDANDGTVIQPDGDVIETTGRVVK